MYRSERVPSAVLAAATQVHRPTLDHVLGQVRRARVARMVKVAGGNRDTKTAGPLGRTLNNLVMSIFFRHFHEKATAWLYPDSSAA